jgi:hypothetical protein
MRVAGCGLRVACIRCIALVLHCKPVNREAAVVTRTRAWDWRDNNRCSQWWNRLNKALRRQLTKYARLCEDQRRH